VQFRYLGEHPADMTTIGVHVEPGDTVEFPDGFEHPLFEAVKPKKGGEKVDAVTE
jgi:hypothetical protein